MIGMVGLCTVVAGAFGCGGGSELTTITVKLSKVASNIKVAYQDGDGAWQMAPPLVANSFSIDIGSTQYAVAVGCEPVVTIDYRTSAETVVEIQPSSICFDADTNTSRTEVSGQLMTVANSSNFLAFADKQSGRFDSGTEAAIPYSLRVKTGTADLLTVRRDNAGSIDRFAIERNLTIAGLTQTKDVDFNTQSRPESLMLQTDPAATYLEYFFEYQTPTSRIAFTDTAPPFELAIPNASQRQAADFFDVYLDSRVVQAGVYVGKRLTSLEALSVPANRMGAVTASTITGSQSLLVNWQPVNGAHYHATGVMECRNCSLYMLAKFSDAWVVQQPSLAWTSPDFTALIGWPKSLMPYAANLAINVVAELGNGDRTQADYSVVGFYNGLPSMTAKPPF